LDNRARKGASPMYIRALRNLLLGQNNKLTHGNGQTSLPLLSQDRYSQLEVSRASVPAYLFRTYSLKNGVRRYVKHKKTNGGNFAHKFEPAAEQNRGLGWACQPTLGHLPVGPTKYMIGMHLLWRDSGFDQFLSWTTSLLFAIEHALGRRARGERDIFIAIVDTRKAYSYVQGEQVSAAFYPALDLCDAFEMHNWRGWGNQRSKDLRPRRSTHEVLSHGTIHTEGNAMRHVPLEEILDKGFFEVFPQFEVDAAYEPSKLYTRLVALRKACFPAVASERLPYEAMYSYTDATPFWSITRRTLEVCFGIAQGFVASPEQCVESEVKAPLHAFLSLLAMQNREREDDTFMTWIRDHDYTGKTYQILRCMQTLEGMLLLTNAISRRCRRHRLRRQISRVPHASHNRLRQLARATSIPRPASRHLRRPRDGALTEEYALYSPLCYKAALQARREPDAEHRALCDAEQQGTHEMGEQGTNKRQIGSSHDATCAG